MASHTASETRRTYARVVGEPRRTAQDRSRDASAGHREIIRARVSELNVTAPSTWMQEGGESNSRFLLPPSSYFPAYPE